MSNKSSLLQLAEEMPGNLSPGTQKVLLTPTTRLPSLKLVRTTPLVELRSCVEYLRFIYNPEVRGSRRRNRTYTDATSEARERDTKLKLIQADAFERSHAIRWLTALIARCDEFLTPQGQEMEETSSRGYEQLIDDAAALLAACAGTAASGRITRTYSLGPSPTGEEVVLRLTDVPLENEDYASVGAQTWGGACVLADMIFEDPERFDLPKHGRIKQEPFRVLELGAGTGLVGLAVARLLELRDCPAEVILTDVHPSVLSNLRTNVAENCQHKPASSVTVSVQSLDWCVYASSSIPDSNTFGMFDLVIGADIIYEAQHAVWIKACLQKLLRVGSSFHLVIPLRRTHTSESSTVEQVFGSVPTNIGFEIVHQEQFFCDAHTDTDFRTPDRSDGVEYVHYKISLPFQNIKTENNHRPQMDSFCPS